MTTTPLTIRGLTKPYPGTLALDGVDLTVRPGTIHALLGANGSGKSTLVKILAGIESAGAAGTVEVGDVVMDAADITPDTSRVLGLRFVHQDIGVFDDLTIVENLAFGTADFSRSWSRIPWSRLRASTAELLSHYGIDADPDDLVANLRPSTRTMLAVARALGRDGSESGSVLILDEPTASLPAEEADELATLLKMCAARGQSIVFISHHLPEVFRLADQVTVLRDGKVVLDAVVSSLDETQLVSSICGRSIERLIPPRTEEVGEEDLLVVEGLSAGPLREVSLTVKRGEIVGVAGLLGTGRTTLLRAIYGDVPCDAGEVTLEGQKVRFADSRDAMRRGVGFVPEDRQSHAAFGAMSVRENHTVASLRSFWRRGLMDLRGERNDARSYIEMFGIKTPSADASMLSLSGGNQQKVVMSRWLRRSPRLLLLDEPSQGVDVGARSDIYATIRAAADQGMGVLLVASDLEELAHASDRVLVIRDGVVAEILHQPIDVEDLTRRTSSLSAA